MTMTPRVIDISHHNVGPLPGGQIDFSALASAGIWGVICKASEGAGYGDPTYRRRREQIKQAGLLHGAYHFNTGEAVMAQVDRFFKEAQPDDTTCMVLDYEKQNVVSKGDMSINQLVAFLRIGEQRLGRKLKIYSGNRLRETIGLLKDPADVAYVASHQLWYCQYHHVADKLPKQFAKYWLWQYTGDGLGDPPHSIKGVSGAGVDLNVFDGTRDQLAASWA
ncbi:lysozyme [Bradyrhizobium brasilense]|uniref:Lysozyme n=1 Tax=Bradyrhizobium brasilense TaxID=1419277 RepID=A0A1G6YZK6_9BRAD|nr:glycoside hydrolase family 25 protein [Bradyrhizobium brasilense]SDD95768.1 lysozyme [Bradyrhizobium brasilense]